MTKMPLISYDPPAENVESSVLIYLYILLFSLAYVIHEKGVGGKGDICGKLLDAYVGARMSILLLKS